ncbi:winged helix-turn-helix transcriptional regulator [Polynucleobacter sp. AP-Elch-400A-B2]|uniref:winged helix-turn-helix domain-containing protein n=1 Tax=Polynucleobacter sp. AP-Elch-400A-B2 TaxID=2576930 RepID=UPI001BFE61BD|nr:winged helix-turn-helix domain-containing protein [Polynucleobacter sp. AP-Elch-400A-B2]QWE24077.1 winged helix-turn-helix transcriptional regulator [Polynucleobacter sp. AP-Elch-400A-B2]
MQKNNRTSLGGGPLLNYARIFRVLGQESRLEVLNLIYLSGEDGIKPKEIIGKLGVDGGTLHFHLDRLRAFNLIVTKAGDPRGIYYPNNSALMELAGFFAPIQAEDKRDIALAA